jgi:hypothetical protein
VGLRWARSEADTLLTDFGVLGLETSFPALDASLLLVGIGVTSWEFAGGVRLFAHESNTPLRRSQMAVG